METKLFFGVVLPETGCFCATFIDREGPINPKTGKPYVHHKWFDDIDELAEFFAKTEKRGQPIDLYHAVSGFDNARRRKQENVVAVRSLFFDLDCGPGKAFPNQRAAIIALATFVDRHRLPVPLVASSGWGIHAYWPFTRDLTPTEWQPLADTLKALALAEGLKIDPACTADSARILRTPGTTNHKKGTRTPAEVLHEGGGPTTPETMASLLGGAPAATAGPSARRASRAPATDDFFGTLRDELPPIDADLMEAECGQVKAALADPAGVAEPLWYKLVGLAAFTTDNAKTARRWSKGHPDYDPARTIAKMEQWVSTTTGPPTCRAFAAENPAGCKGCPHEVTSPARIIVAPVSEPMPVVAGAPEPPPLPKGYFVKDGGIYIRKSKVVRGMTVHVEDKVYRSMIYPVLYYNDPNAERVMVEWCWMDEHDKLQTATLPARATNAGNIDFRNQVADTGIATLDDITTPLLKDYMNLAYKGLRERQPENAVVATMGWQKGFRSFAIGEQIITADGIRPTQVSSQVARVIEGYGAKGSQAKWLEMTTILAQHKMYPQQIAVGIGMASILMPFTGLNGAAVSYYGVTGTGKTTAENIQQSIWGNPRLLVRGANTTLNALYGTFAVTGNLPVALDEVGQTLTSSIGDLLYSVSVGREKDRMDKNAMIRASRQWCLTALFTGNQPLAEHLASAGASSDAQQRRLLEVELEPNHALTKSMEIGKRLQNLCYNHYGHIGPLWAKTLLELGEKNIRRLIDQSITAVTKMGYKGDGTDRFHITILALIHLSLTIAYQQGWIAFGPTRAMGWMIEQVTDQKVQQADATDDHFDLVNLFLNEHATSSVIVTKTEDHTANNVVSDVNRVGNKGLVARYLQYRTTRTTDIYRGKVFVSRTLFSEWLLKRGANLRTVSRALHRDKAVISSNRVITLAADTMLPMARIRCLVLDLFHPRMEQAHTTHLRVITGGRPPVDLV